MFAVPGWAVSAASLIQEKPLSSRSSDQPSSGTSTSAAKKRTHPQAHAHRASKVSGTELERLWNQHNQLKQPRSDGKSSKQHYDQAEGQDSKRGSQTDGQTRKTANGVPRKKRDGEHSQQPRNEVDGRRAARDEKSDIAPHEQLLATRRIVHNGKSPKTKEERNDKKKGAQRKDKHERHGANKEKTEQAIDQVDTSTEASHLSTKKALANLPPPAPTVTKLTPLQAKMRNKLTSARFRHLNETLYTTSSASAMDLFTASPDLFAEYHAGFSQQVKDSWPQNPVDQYIKHIRARGTLPMPNGNNMQPLPRRKTGSCTVADLGCGDAPLARGCQSAVKSLQLKFHNFDLHSPNTFVTKADIANLPLRDGEADIVVFCLSLMGTNWVTFVEEAWRILRGDGKGEVWVAEVKSRFGRVSRDGGPRVVENSVGKRRKTQKPKNSLNDDDDALPPEALLAEDTTNASENQDATDISAFVKVFARRGFQMREDSVEKNNKMFVSMVFVKSGIPTAGKHKGLKWTGREYQRQQLDGGGKMRFAGGQGKGAMSEDVLPEEEAKALKPCVYKTR